MMFRSMVAAAAMVAAVPANAFDTPEKVVPKIKADAQCHPGKDEPSGDEGSWSGGLRGDVAALTPYTVPGGTRVSRPEADCLLFAYGARMRFITPIDDQQLIPYTSRVPFGGNGPGDYPQVAEKLKEITGGDLDYPLVAYCHSIYCYLSYNLVVRAAQLGYRNLYWLRDGVDAYQTLMVRGEYSPADEKTHLMKFVSEFWFCRSFFTQAYGKEGEPSAAAIPKIVGISADDPDIAQVSANNDEEVRTKLADARKRDADAAKAGQKSYAEHNYKAEWLGICNGMLRGAGAID